MSKFFIFGVFCVALALRSIRANEEVKQALLQAYKPIIEECSQAHGVTQEQIKEAKENNNPQSIDSCFIGCLLTKTEIINSEGIFDPTVAMTKIKEYVKDEEKLAKIESITNKCTSVNEKSVSDGAAGCERAELLMTCLLQNRDELQL